MRDQERMGRGSWGNDRSNSYQNDNDFTFGRGNTYRNENRGYGYGSGANERDWTERTGDEVRSWFGDDDAERRRRMDEMRDNSSNRNRNSWFGNDRDRDNWGSSSRYGSSNRDSFDNSRTIRSGQYDTGNDRNYGYGSGYDNDRYRSSNRYTSGSRYDRDRDNDRGFFERTGDEVRSWFGDDEAERRRRMDQMRDYSGDRNYERENSYRRTSSNRRDNDWW
jgi:osmotically-inducible protein OsmY